MTALSHHRSGTGEPLVLIHGIGSRWQLWQPLLPALSSRFDVIALDLPGFGASPLGAPGRLSFGCLPFGRVFFGRLSFGGVVGGCGRGCLRRRRHPFRGLGVPLGPVFHVAGSSLGGGVALELGRRGVARSVTAFAPIGFWGPISRRWCQASVSGARLLGRLARPALPTLATTAAGRIALFSMFFGHPARLDPATCIADVDALVAAPAFAPARAAFAGHHFRDPGALPDIPVTVAWGSRDAILPAFQARRAATALPSARHVRLRGCGHLPFSDDPASCTTLIQTTAT